MTEDARVAAILERKLRELEDAQKVSQRAADAAREAERKVELIQVQVNVLREAAGEVIEPTQAAPRPLPPPPPPLPPSKRRRGPSGLWRRVMVQAAQRFPEQFTLDDLVDISRQLGDELPRGTARSQAANYVGYGWLNRIEQGKFNFTQEGRSELGVLPFTPPVPSAPPLPPKLWNDDNADNS